MRSSSKVVRFEDGSYGRIIKVRSGTVKRTSIATVVRSYVDFMFDKLLEWLEDEVWYNDLNDMLEDAVEYIYEELVEAPESVTPCDNGVLSTTMFVDYVFKGVLWTDSDIADDLNGWVFEPEDLLDNMRVVECFEELTKFRDALKSMIKVKIKGVNVNEED